MFGLILLGFRFLAEVTFTGPLLLVLHHKSVVLVFRAPTARYSGVVVAGPGAGHLHPDVGEDCPGHARGVRD